MNIVDLILVIVVLLAVWSSIIRGFIASLGGLIVWVGTLAITLWLYRYLTSIFENQLGSNVWAATLILLVLLLFVTVLCSSLVNRAFAAIPTTVHRYTLNKIFGFLPGLIVGLLYAATLSWIFLLLPVSGWLTSQTRDSQFAQTLSRPFAEFAQQMATALGNPVSRMINDPGSTEYITLPFSVEDATPRPDLESEMLNYLNAERVKHGLSPLAFDEELLPVARQHAQDMFARSYFSHISPEEETPFDRIRKANIPFLTAGENLAIAQTLALAHDGLMDSPGHRANILQQAFGRVGIGVLDGGVYGLMVVQKFRN